MHGYESTANLSFDDVDAGAYDALVLPGGKAPLIVRKQRKALDAVKTFFRDNKPVFAICHGQQVLVSADVLKGRRATSYWNMAQELKDAGARYEDSEVVVDGNLVTSRQPSDLPAFMREMLKALRQYKAACTKAA
jgi:protease I